MFLNGRLIRLKTFVCLSLQIWAIVSFYWGRLAAKLGLTWINKKDPLKSAATGETTCCCIQNIQRGIMQRDYSSPEQSLNFKFPSTDLRLGHSTSFSCCACSLVQQEKAFSFPASGVGRDLSLIRPMMNVFVSVNCSSTELIWGRSRNYSPGWWPARSRALTLKLSDSLTFQLCLRLAVLVTTSVLLDGSKLNTVQIPA